MSNQIIADASPPGIQPVVLWLREKLAEANRCLAARKHSEATWRGNDKEWASEENAPPKKARLTIADREARIAVKYRRDIEMITRLITVVGETGKAPE